MLKRRNKNIFVVGMLLVLVLGSCRNNNLPWRAGSLVTQLYRQYKQEILLGYNNFQQEMLVDDQHGYARAYFDNYRNQIIFTTQWSLDYLIGNKQITTATDEITGYVYQVLMNDKYQIGIEVMALERDELGTDNFFGAKTRIIDLNTQKSVTITGFPAKCMLGTTFVYCDNYDDNEHDFLDIIDVQTMEHTRLDTESNQITFFYQMGDKIFAQSSIQEKNFLINGKQLFEQTEKTHNVYRTSDPSVGKLMLKDIAPINIDEHWYLNELRQYQVVYWAELLKFSADKAERVFIDFNRDDIIQIVDMANYGRDYVAILYETRITQDDPIHQYIDIYDMSGKLVEQKEVTDLAGGKKGRFTALDYVA